MSYSSRKYGVNDLRFSRIDVIMHGVFLLCAVFATLEIGRSLTFYVTSYPDYEIVQLFTQEGLTFCAVSAFLVVSFGALLIFREKPLMADASDLRNLVWRKTNRSELTVFDDRAELIIALSGAPLLALTSTWITGNQIISDVGASVNLIGTGVLWFAYRYAKIKRSIDLRLFTLTHTLYFILTVYAFILSSFLFIIVSYFVGPIVTSFVSLFLAIILYLVLFLLFAIKDTLPKEYVLRKWHDVEEKSPDLGETLQEVSLSLTDTAFSYTTFYVLFFVGVVWLRFELEIGTPSWGVLILAPLIPALAHQVFVYFEVGHLLQEDDEPLVIGFRRWAVLHPYAITGIIFVVMGPIWFIVLWYLTGLPVEQVALSFVVMIPILFLWTRREIRRFEEKHADELEKIRAKTQ